MKRFAFVFFFSCLAFTAHAGSNDPILTIGQKTFESGEFWFIYQKNQHLDGFSESPEVFAERYINYKLKVVEAQNRGLDTLGTFKQELEGYVSDLANSYLVDSAALNSVVEQAHHNMQSMVEASHILVSLDKNADPVDTLRAWEQMKDIRQQALSGKDFNELAERYSMDRSARQNRGHLGYFTTFGMVYPFERMAFSTPVDSVSPIFRTSFGYHILKVHDRRPNPGKIRLAHLMKALPNSINSEENARVEAEVWDLYRRINEGASFEDLARQHSDHHKSAVDGGVMPALGMGQMAVELADIAFALPEDGAVSEPMKTKFGWHILKRLELQEVGTLEEEYAYIMSMLSRDGRNNAGRDSFLSQRMNSSELNYRSPALGQIYTAFSESVDKDSFLSALKDSLQVLVSYKGRERSIEVFKERVRQDPGFFFHDGQLAVDRLLEAVVQELIMSTERELLIETNEAYRYLVQEYFDGLLVFEISTQEIWNERASDSLALRNFYQEHLGEFTPSPQMTGTVCATNNKRLQRRVEKIMRKESAGANVVQILKENARSVQDYRCESGQFAFVEDASNPLDVALLPEGSSLHDLGNVLYWEGNLQSSEVLFYEEVVGEVVRLYQNYLEENWLRDLRQRYRPQFNYRLLK